MRSISKMGGGSRPVVRETAKSGLAEE
jgi:hypothetical protein